MTWAKWAALIVAFVAAVALGVLIGPHITHRDRTASDTTASAATSPAAVDESQQPAPNRAVPRSSVKRMRKAPAKSTGTATTSIAVDRPVGSTPPEVPPAAPALHERLKPLLNKGADMGKAAEDFNDAEQFAAVAHASRNTDIPFMVLKYHTVNERKNLEEAIRELKPDVNAAAEARKAREQAKTDVSALTTG
jgi:hypothetical protein